MFGDERITLEQALEDILLGEIRQAERYFGKTFGADDETAMSPMESLAMGMWARERRLRPTGGFTLDDTQKVSMKDATTYFAEEVPEVDPEDPETDEGKDGSNVAMPPESEPSSAPS